MLSARLIHLIESHWDEITGRVLRRIRQNPELTHMGGLSDTELRERGRPIVVNLGHWLSAGNEQELARRYEFIGRERSEEGVPLHESLHALLIIKHVTMDFVHEQGPTKCTMDVLAEEELERRVDAFFDVLVCHLAKGYEAALRRELALPARAMKA
jgi:hypothetical protein